MKKVFNTLSALLLIQVAAYAQQPANRTSATKIVDVLAQQPADEINKFTAAMKELQNFTAEDIANLLTGLKPQGASNAATEYAANSYSFYVMQPGMEVQREVFSQGLILALDRLQDKDNKGFVLQLMKQASKNEAIDALVPYLKDEYLVDKAAMALNGIRTPEAAQALSNALTSSASEKTAIAIVGALGDLRSKNDEEAIIATLAQYTSENYQRNAYTALGKIAGTKSAPVFLAKLKEVNYQFDKTNIGGLTLDYANNLLDEGQQKQAISIANTVAKEAAKAEAPTLQVGALTLLTRANPAKARKQLMKATTSSEPLYRAAALDLLAENGTDADTKKLIGTLRKSSPEVQESILNYLAAEGTEALVPDIQKSLGSLKYTRAKIAGLNTLSKLSSDGSTDYLISELPEADEATTQAIEALLLSSKDSAVVDKINAAITGADTKTQVALLNVLATRTNANSSKVVLPLLTASDNNVKAAALKALPNVVNPEDVDVLIGILANTPESDARYVQEALVIALNARSDKDAKISQLAVETSRNPLPTSAKIFPVFAGLGGAESLQTVESFLKNKELKNSALLALANWSDPEVLPTLIKLSRSERVSEHFGAIFNGLVKQINASDHTNEQKTLLLKDAFELAENTAQKRTVLSNLQATGTYQAMMFAAQYMDDKDLKGAATNTALNIATDSYAFIGTDVRNILNKAMENLTGNESSYLREAIIRHLTEMPAGEGYSSIFNGKDLTGWKGLVENPIKRATMAPQELEQKQAAADKKMRDSWRATNGELVFSGEGDNIATVKPYGDFEMLVDWKLDPNGKEPDAGVYLRGTPQVQIWDISRTNVGAEVGSGGLYNNQRHPSKPLKVADNALGEWNTFKIRMVGENVSVWLNGELVVDNVILENYWDRHQSIFPVEQIELQAHGSRVWYRDIYVKELARKETYTLSNEEKEEGFVMLFDGRDLDQWTETSAYEITPEGYVRANPDAKFGKNLYTKEEYADFVYRFEFKLTPGANNGVGIRTPLEGDAAYVGTEIQILDNDAAVYKNLKEHQYHGSAYGIIPAKREGMKPLGEWNTQEIRVQGDKIKVTLNGVVILDGDLAEASKNGTLDGKDHPGLRRKSGHIGFLGHGSEVFFRNIRVKRL
ncbi:family 16 glycoside hydrolase [Sphingobacterium corticibacterium]|uniref:DUF1080 domain-containing protein n=1 Tax=Sphingobacterium corticibacterium TaxID=2484746 RepID=A0A4Q6Y0C4_9SPHI|nr:family 16 glycoside hydrolase [Sphingobacterium corticibacterium]RZF62396.1 DUF1080 domain-containing protein [Sphingobacterium corticibacterium]